MTRPGESARNCHNCANDRVRGKAPHVNHYCAVTEGTHGGPGAVGGNVVAIKAWSRMRCWDRDSLPPRETDPCPGFAERGEEAKAQSSELDLLREVVDRASVLDLFITTEGVPCDGFRFREVALEMRALLRVLASLPSPTDATTRTRTEKT